MQFEVKDLINKIKKDGLEEAERVSNDIILKAKREAEEIVAKAEEAARVLKAKSEKEANDYKSHAIEASRQAIRDLIIGVEKNLKSLFENTLQENVTEVFSDNNFLAELIIKITDSWFKEEKLVIQLNESDFSSLEQVLRLKLKNKLKEGMEIKPFKGINKGFKIQKKNIGLYYDFSVETIAGILFDYLNPRFKEVVKVV
ncbi:V-type ATP synthase subunit E [Borreliella yangtzensis]|uniref:V-type proton ATPase subunit E n=1 Tax=Borreliella yangtzensis TaxID=683292 RepID=A0ABR6PA41_9SPIR|nr:V-type ATP synthase subunit E [Borreliella yangtzensis]MBB6043146.1 V/A-type H+-transporting ATPase subunit E [Borreliella yangtzensis]WKC73091.1 V-type ATP synthase subunit E [Borreliella yangtzensis]WKC74008.1 V-type ATP synthase subunit E [Borreliella yangtzensis]